MNTLEISNSADTDVRAQKERVVKMIMEIDDALLLGEIEDYLSEIVPADAVEEQEDWDSLPFTLQERLKESVAQSENGQTHKLEDVLNELHQRIK